MKNVLAVVYRDALIRLTSLTWLFFDMAVPLLYLLMFGVGFNKAVGLGVISNGASVAYNDFFLAGVLSMSCFGSAINQAYGFFVDRDNGIFYEFLTYPMTRGEFLLGKMVFQCVMSLAQTALTLTAAVVILGIPVNVMLLPLTVIVVMAGIAGWFFALSIVAFRIKRNDTFNTVINVAYFVLMFVSSMFYPLDAVPDWLRYISYANPLTWHTDVLRYLTVGIGSSAAIAAETFGFTAFLFISFWFAQLALKKTV
ncbi:MAG: ABC transporter permease [Bacteriovoracaceae bacterium]|nr:ABC transporter permease [Bacteroidota bacterium]